MSSSPAAAVIKGRKKVVPPSANVASLSENVACLSLHASYEEIEQPSTDVSASVDHSRGSLVWALHDTGATHHMFNNLNLFVKSSMVMVSNSNKRLKLAGGDVSLAVYSEGKVKLKAGDGSTFELTDCLYIPD